MYSGPKIIENGLVFGLDTGHPFTSFSPAPRFYRGEPTTNLIPTPTTNAYPTTGNGWGTYNTNQYGSGTYFSIGTISSVSNNIVTMTAAHSLRTYDVMQPQTTGGGVTAGVNYFIKKISSTQFSLHAYNSSQDGSQGYINPSTGTFKVHDSIATDTRILINATSFPTMWWGYPHLPNSGLVKEIIRQGFKQTGGITTDCIRQHITRDSGTDHMAYGVDASFTPNSPVYCSFWARSVDSNAVGKVISFYHYTYGIQAANGYAVSCTLGPVGVWQRFGYTFTSPNNTVISYWFNPDGPYKYDIANIQIEQKNRASSFVAGTRSATNSLIDAIKVSSIDVSNISFNSTGLPIFDGTNDSILVASNSSNNVTGDITIECIAKRNSGQGVLVHKEVQYTLLIYSDGSVTYADSSLWSYSSFGAHGSAFTSGVYHHIVVTKTGGIVSIYIDNNLIISKSFGSSISSTSNQLCVGSYNNSSNYFNGEIPVTRIYNRALSTTEVASNFKAYQKRFNI
jgi:hypothetical protein